MKTYQCKLHGAKTPIVVEAETAQKAVELFSAGACKPSGLTVFIRRVDESKSYTKYHVTFYPQATRAE